MFHLLKSELFQVTSGVINERLAEAEKTEEMITVSREKYRPVAARGSVMYFVVANMGEVDPMYQFSLKYFKQLFSNTIESSEKSSDLEKRLLILLEQTTRSVYNNVARGLFEKDKLVFSFMLCGDIMRQENKISEAAWSFFLRGASGMDKVRQPKPDVSWLSQQVWNTAVDLSDNLPIFKGLEKEIVSTPIFVKVGDLVVSKK
jgi:dynein heavy chain